jgi:hypothetical protein
VCLRPLLGFFVVEGFNFVFLIRHNLKLSFYETVLINHFNEMNLLLKILRHLSPLGRGVPS